MSNDSTLEVGGGVTNCPHCSRPREEHYTLWGTPNALLVCPTALWKEPSQGDIARELAQRTRTDHDCGAGHDPTTTYKFSWLLPKPLSLACYECGLLYEGLSFCDVVVPDDVWAKISPTGDGGGILCFTCMVSRLTHLGLSGVPIEIMSGPFATHKPPAPTPSPSPFWHREGPLRPNHYVELVHQDKITVYKDYVGCLWLHDTAAGAGAPWAGPLTRPLDVLWQCARRKAR